MTTYGPPKAAAGPPPGWTFFSMVPAVLDWRIQWLDANNNIIQEDPIIGFIFWQDASTNFRCDPMCWYGPIFYTQQTSPYKIVMFSSIVPGNITSPSSIILDPSRGY